jgi:hypothetical protein
MSWCKKRITNPQLMFRVGAKESRFYMESVCAASCTVGQTLCAKCLNYKEQTKTQDSSTYPHGSVDAEYADDSRIFGGPKYLKYVKEHGDPPQDILALAMEAQKRARAGRKSKSIQELKQTTVGAVDEEKKQPTAEVADAAPKEKAKAQTTRKVKVKKPIAPPPVQNVLAVLGAHTEKIITSAAEVAPGQLVETTDTPMEVAEVIEVILKPFTHNNVKYWRDGAREKLYRRTADGKRGEYVGRWDADAEEIVRDAPDSDADSDC